MARGTHLGRERGELREEGLQACLLPPSPPIITQRVKTRTQRRCIPPPQQVPPGSETPAEAGSPQDFLLMEKNPGRI